MIADTRPIRAWRVLVRHESTYYNTPTLRYTVLGESVEEVMAIARVRFTMSIRGYISTDSVPVIVDVKPYVRLSEM